MNNEWRTPLKLYQEQDAIHHFKVDLAASDEYHLCEKYFTREDSALSKSWINFESCWCNPPYFPKDTITEWAEKAWNSVIRARDIGRSLVVVMLLPVRTDQQWFHKYCLSSAISTEIKFIKGRISFLSENYIPGSVLREPSMLITFKYFKEQRL